ncbi:hypothetical protein ACQP3C_27770, partial [Escherichia coli]
MTTIKYWGWQMKSLGHMASFIFYFSILTNKVIYLKKTARIGDSKYALSRMKGWIIRLKFLFVNKYMLISLL